METILVISDEPALAQALADELPQYTIMPLKTAEASAKLPAAIKLVVAEKRSAETIALHEKDVAQLTITRPVRLRELIYTIKERLQAQNRLPHKEITLPGGRIFSARERVISLPDGEQKVMLTEKEGELFTVLLNQKGKIISKDQLLKEVWGYHAEADTHTLETHIYRLRGKLRQIDAEYDIISSDEKGYVIKI